MSETQLQEIQNTLATIQQQLQQIERQTLTNSEQIPYLIQEALNQFIKQLTEAMQKTDSNNMKESIEELTQAIQALYHQNSQHQPHLYRKRNKKYSTFNKTRQPTNRRQNRFNCFRRI